MRILIVGAGGTGGYFGGRLLAAGRDVTFLVRPARAAILADRGLVIRSRFGDLEFAHPPTVTAEDLRRSFDLVIVSCKAYDLSRAMDSFAAAVGPNTAILPLLNGMAHLDALDLRFGREHVLGGVCVISAALDIDGNVRHLSDLQSITFGERNGAGSARSQSVCDALSGAGFDVRQSANILQDMWEKWVFIASGAALTCLMRASIDDILAAGGTAIASRLIEECAAIATTAGFPPRQAALERCRSMLTVPGSTFAASMARDLENNAPVEADHIVGDLLSRAGGASPPPEILGIAYVHLKAYLARRARSG
jgi:2-dehydropantoate 2-reductase